MVVDVVSGTLTTSGYWTSAQAGRLRQILSLNLSLLDFFHHTRIKQGSCIAQVLHFSFCDLSQNAPHDFSASCFGKSAYKLNFIGFGNGANYSCNGCRNISCGSVRYRLHVPWINHISINALSFYIMRISHHSTFHHTCMHINGILHFGCTNAVTAYIQYIIYPSGDPVNPSSSFKHHHR